MKGKIFKIILFFLICFYTPFLSAAVTIEDTGWLWDKDENNDGHGDLNKIYWMEKGNKSYFLRCITFNTGKHKISLTYRVSDDPTLLQTKSEYYGWDIGMSGTGWYGNGFIDILINTFSLRNWKPEISSELKGDTADAVFFWDTSEAKIKMTFFVQSGDDKLFLKVTIEPKKEIKTIETALLCYPSGWGSFDCVKENYPELMDKRDRWVSTYKRDIQHSEKKVTLEKDEFWVLYYDKIWDKATKEKCCFGPCALLFPPDEPEKVELNIYNYDIRTYLYYPSDIRELNYLFWQSMNIPNEEALEIMKNFKLK